ncbi:bifunctional DNA-formamidopyrimidine glycosylase/DNA-(apurinic or apyrimidinic site) lyase [Actinomycetospora sp. TBRC 11914]|uniref:bifunctional DNA-formamidopyrimidine glycosylase/DNA-(apurinic or apyrimidinic site) lyase n=1 Tax=Actinomycetospora sp. TBRC 11914 TaxID=2729387 RepID=UPI00145F8497|nr:bifunctional DNA-formamidopyrimidine glycosylase/DNA-(apurinic or apyrimidinic site) lyase [Actinomycetospora sp. TBRC 11914]NMO91129.1 bifunctional DNA-formamidopyrimidine glycosylase/DNA-(apurinic or apyrimidinic site) lyase [Actinomycetospora sp. TBRC 11914]
MPELPEVEVVRRGLADHAVGRTVSSVEVRHPRAVRRQPGGAPELASRLAGRTLAAARRRGKFLWLDLTRDGEPDGAVLAHLGMSGQLLVQPAERPDETHLRVRVRFDDGGSELRFVDQRTFGGLTAVDTAESDGETVPALVAHIGRDPLDPRFDREAAVGAYRRRRTELKRALLDQTVVSGIGNIYADEALWRARLHSLRPTATLTRPEGRRVLDAAAEVMGEALAAGGTSFDALYVDVHGDRGYFERSLAVYGREDEPCPRDGTPIVRTSFTNRSSYWCPTCQKAPRKVR